MAKFKPFNTFNTQWIIPNNCFLEEYVEEESINHFNGKPYQPERNSSDAVKEGMVSKFTYYLPRKDGVVW